MQYLTKRSAALPPYIPGTHEADEDVLLLNSNESPYPPSKGVREAILSVISGLNVYNDPDCRELREALAARLCIRPENVMAANGSDQALYLSLMAFAGEERTVLLPQLTYDYYDDFAAALGVRLEKKSVRGDFSLDPADFREAGKMVLFPNPNAPTGLALSLKEIKSILEADVSRIVVIDEAYAEFGAESALPLIADYPNLLITRTFSKSGSLAGARLGYALGSAELISELSVVRSACDLYGVSAMAQAAGAAACREWEYYEENCKKIVMTREWSKKRLKVINCELTESLGNFLFVKPPLSAKYVYEKLREYDILVRYWDKPFICDRLRITVGTMEQMKRLCDAMERILKEEP